MLNLVRNKVRLGTRVVTATGLVVLGFSAANPAEASNSEAASSKNLNGNAPNIVYILADDMGYNDVSLMGQENFETPNLDRMAGEGLLFTDHYAGSTVCAPSRAALLISSDF